MEFRREAPIRSAARLSVTRRRFIGAVGAGSIAAVLGGPDGVVKAAPVGQSEPNPQQAPVNGKFVVPPLPYDYDALEPEIATLTMQVHHDRLHQNYVNNLNNALANYPELQNTDATALIANLDAVPEAIRTTVRNNAGGHVNHSIFWAIMAPNGGGAPVGTLAAAINARFGSFDDMKAQFNAAGVARFGSGWAWLVLDGNRELQIVSTPNQDSPYMMGMIPIIGNDVWEHAYFLTYLGQRAEYLAAWWNKVNWFAAEQRYAGSL